MTAAREAILAHVRGAVGGAQPPTVPRDYRRAGTLDLEARVALLCSRISE